MVKKTDKGKPWERTKSYRRHVNEREPKETFLIVCEGAKTEPNYFNSFRVRTATIKVEGAGDNTVNLVKIALRLKKEQAKEGPPYDQVWCVFDRDDFPAERFNEAFAVAAEHGIKLAYSNQAFELWYLLHFIYCDAAISRALYIEKLDKLLGHKYEKNSRTIYEELLEKQPDAIRNAARLLATYIPREPEKNDPSTTAHLLVEQLNKYI